MDYSVEEHGHLGRQRHGSSIFYDMLAEMANLHDRKSHDYAKDSNPFGNYHFAGSVAALFAHSPDDAGFAGRLAEKMFRLSVLEGGQLQPKNESIADTELDIGVLAVLWMADRRTRRLAVKSPEQKQSEDAACRMIELEKYLSSTDRQQMIDYLRACQRDSTTLDRKSENPSRT